MTIKEQVKTLCIARMGSVSKMAERLKITQAALSDRLRKEAFTPAKLAELAVAAGCGYESTFTLASGQRLMCALDAVTGELMPSTADQIVELCRVCEISKAELARRIDMRPQGFSSKLKLDTLRPDDLKAIANAVGCTYTSAFIMPNGDRITY